MDKNISIVGINGDFLAIKKVKVDKNFNIDLNHFGTEQITESDLFLQKQLSK